MTLFIYYTVAALHQGAPGQMTWLEDPPPWLRPAKKFLPYLTADRIYLFYFDSETISAALAAFVF